MPSKIARPLGILLLVVGLVGVVWGGISWVQDSGTVEAGPVEMTVQERESLPIHPALGGLLLVAGVALLLVDRRA